MEHGFTFGCPRLSQVCHPDIGSCAAVFAKQLIQLCMSEPRVLARAPVRRDWCVAIWVTLLISRLFVRLRHFNEELTHEICVWPATPLADAELLTT